MLQIWGVISSSSSSSQAPGAPSPYLQFPDWAIIYSTQMTIIHTVKSRQNLIPKANPSQIVDWKDNKNLQTRIALRSVIKVNLVMAIGRARAREFPLPSGCQKPGSAAII
jgi:hypothetical protein